MTTMPATSHETGPRGPCRRVGGVSGHLNPGGQQFRGDRGGADPRVTSALAAYQAGQGSEQAALGALAAARLLVPVIAVLGDGSSTDTEGDTHGDKDSEMVLPTLIGRDGRPAVLAFTGLDALARWRPDARPVPAEADRVWRAAVADGCARWPPGSPHRRRTKIPMCAPKSRRRSPPSAPSPGSASP